MLTEEQILFIVNRPVVDQDAPLKQFQLETGRLIEQAVRKEMEGDAKDAERYRWLRDQHWVEPEARFRLGLSHESEGNSSLYDSELAAAIDAARGQT